MTENEIGTIIVDSAVKLHKAIRFDGEKITIGFRADMIVENKVITELKSVEIIKPVHKKQLLTYLKLSGIKVGYLLNFGDYLMKDGITRIINETLD